MPEKVAELTKLHDTWLAEMAEPVKSGEKRFGMKGSEASPKKKPKAARKKRKRIQE
jgi:hypothetical protein